jgi:LysR family cys regulon transcriptional activator
MTLKQFRYICEVVRQGLRLSTAAAAVQTSQPGVSKQIQLLERELGVMIFRRNRNRILSLTPAGKEIVKFAETALRAAQSIEDIGRDARDTEGGDLVIATTHTHARYTLPNVMQSFAVRHPKVRLHFLQGHRNDIFKAVEEGEADIAIGTDSDEKLEAVALIPYGSFHRIAVTPRGHPLLRTKRVTLQQLLEYPLIMYGLQYRKPWKLNHIFEEKQLTPNVVFSAADADIAKTYVEMGTGIAILPHVTFDRAKDKSLRFVDVGHLFPAEVTQVGLSRERYVRRHIFDFLGILSPKLTRAYIRSALTSGARQPDTRSSEP